MALYVTYYGFSYEKFFASYTVVFCAILLSWLGTKTITRAKAGLIRFPIVLFLWMYAVLTVIPVERIILRSNVALSRREGSQIRLFELTMLSPDVLGLVRRYQKEGVLNEKNLYYAREEAVRSGDDTGKGATFDWNPWIMSRSEIVSSKAWYEMNVTNLITPSR